MLPPVCSGTAPHAPTPLAFRRGVISRKSFPPRPYPHTPRHLEKKIVSSSPPDLKTTPLPQDGTIAFALRERILTRAL